jgi:hypothetical protein
MKTLPNALLSIVADVLAENYSHVDLDSHFADCGFPGEPPAGSKPVKCKTWLRQANAAGMNTVAMTGRLLEGIMDRIPLPDEVYIRGPRPKDRLEMQMKADGFVYKRGGRLMSVNANLVAQTLENAISSRDLTGVQEEFERIAANVDKDPAAAATASCALLESMFKMYLADEQITLPADESILPLWKLVRNQLKLNATDVHDDNLKKILSGISSIVDGIAGLRTRRGSAHGHDARKGYRIESRHARLASQAAFTLGMFFLETVETRKSPKT